MYTQLYTYKIWFPQRPFRAEKQLYGNQNSRGMVEGECIHRENLIPKTGISSQKAALRESNFKKIPKATELLKCFFPEPCSDACPTWQNNLKRNLRLPCARLGFKTGIAKAAKTSLNPTKPSMCIHSPSTIPLEIDSRKASFWLEMAVLGIKPSMSMCIQSPSTKIPPEIWFP